MSQTPDPAPETEPRSPTPEADLAEAQKKAGDLGARLDALEKENPNLRSRAQPIGGIFGV